MKQTIITITGEGDAMEMEVKVTDYVTNKTATYSFMIGKDAKAKATNMEFYKIQKQVINEIIGLCKYAATTLPDKSVTISELPKQ